MITPGIQNFSAYIGSTFDTIITIYPSADATYNWVGPWSLGQNYSTNTVVIGTDNNAYDAQLPNISVNPVGDITGTWSTPLVPLNLNGWTGYITISPTTGNDLTTKPLLATPVQIQGKSGTLFITFTPAQSTTPLVTANTYHHYVTLTDPNANTYYYLNGTFTWQLP